MAGPEIGFADSEGGFIAFQVMGSGESAVAYIPNWGNTVEALWESPCAETVLRRLAGTGKLILFDKRGTGVSDPLRKSYASTPDLGGLIEEAVQDLWAVLDHVGVDRVSLVANIWGTSVAMLAAATQPERVTSLVLVDPTPRWRYAADYPWGLTDDVRAAAVEGVRTRWGSGTSLAWLVPTMRRDPEFMRWLARYERLSLTPGVMAGYWGSMDVDVRSVLRTIQCPTLVLHHVGNRAYDAGAALYTAEQILGAEGPIAIESPDLEIYAPQPAAALEAMAAYLSDSSGVWTPVELDRAFSVILFTDIVQSTTTAAELGDRRWRDLLEVHNSVISRRTTEFRGREVKRTGDGVLATFDGPAKAVRCAQAIVTDLAGIGISIRAGIHAGEVEVMGDDIGGIAVHIGQRVSAAANAGEVVVSRTIVDLVAGSGLEFSDGVEHQLKGVPGTWTLFSVLDSAPRALA